MIGFSNLGGKPFKRCLKIEVILSVFFIIVNIIYKLSFYFFLQQAIGDAFGISLSDGKSNIDSCFRKISLAAIPKKIAGRKTRLTRGLLFAKS